MNSASTSPSYPSPPSSINDLGIAASLIEDIILQRLVIDGRSSVSRMAQATALSVGVVDSTVDGLRQRMYLEIQGMDGRDYILAPTEKGKTEAANRAQALMYAGAAPVSLDDYTAMVESQRGRAPINAATLTEAFNDLIIPPGFFDELGPALVSKGCLLYTSPSPRDKRQSRMPSSA